MNQKELKEILELHKLWLKRRKGGKKANLQGANLREANLQRANLQGANLHEAYLYEANLQGANLQGANLRGADLRKANLQGANLQGANLQGAYLQGANLQRANLYEAYLQGADLQRVNLQGANLDFSCWPLCCGSKDVKVDKRLVSQLAAHLYSLSCDDPEFQELKSSLLKLASQSHIWEYLKNQDEEK